ncbi:PREDICTED: short-chain dehydrogenase/reductase 3 [Eurypyga helias]|uniref:short-chain dehydrogenase/reductase 3 n=1 Tax=Eurypyga helias TaxID=54383 RepID=UPI00052849A6|nr:PREDICTED: short-chain dehydrogenase/reductase 3 [Eurypyga helias]
MEFNLDFLFSQRSFSRSARIAACTRWIRRSGLSFGCVLFPSKSWAETPSEASVSANLYRKQEVVQGVLYHDDEVQLLQIALTPPMLSGRAYLKQKQFDSNKSFWLQIILWGRTEKCLKETTEEIRMMGTECHYFICDVGNREEVYRQAKAVREKVGDITILVNNAAVVHGKSLMDSDDDALLKSQHINTLGQFWEGFWGLFLHKLGLFGIFQEMIKQQDSLPRMLELQNGHIVCLNSVLALSAIPGAIDYCTSKASSFAFMESLTLGLLDCPGVNATTVLPFHTSTEMFQGMRIRFPNLFPPLKPETVARRTVEAVQLNQAFLLLPWTMHVLVILKSILPQAALEEIHKFSGSYTCMNTFKGRT